MGCFFETNRIVQNTQMRRSAPVCEDGVVLLFRKVAPNKLLTNTIGLSHNAL